LGAARVWAAGQVPLGAISHVNGERTIWGTVQGRVKRSGILSILDLVLLGIAPMFLWLKRQLDTYCQLLRLKLAIIKAHYYDAHIGIEANSHCPVKEDLSLNQDMCPYLPTFYGRIEKMIDFLKLTNRDIFIDLGCGKGRVVFRVALEKLKKVIGVEIDKDLIDIARRNLNNLKRRNTPIELINSDAATYQISDENIFFIFNPFGYQTLQNVILNIKQSLITHPRKVRIVYYVPEYKDLLDSQDWLFLETNIENDGCLVWCSR
jgi:SAM-dependent methyltransferase